MDGDKEENQPKRQRKASRRLSSKVDEGEFVVSFEGMIAKRWKLPSQGEKDKIRVLRLQAVQFVAQNGATVGQQDYIRQVLWKNGYGSGRLRRKLNGPRSREVTEAH